MAITDCSLSDFCRDRIIAHFPADIICRSAVILQNSLLALQFYVGNLPNYESANVALFNFRTNKLVKYIRLSTPLPPSNLQQHTLLVDPTEKYLIVCDDYSIVVLSKDRAFKVFSKLKVPNTLLTTSIPYNRINQPLSRIKVLNNQELLISEGSSLLRWNFHLEKDVSHLQAYLSFDFNNKVADFYCDSEKNLLFVMIEMLSACENCEIIIYDLTDLTRISSIKLDWMCLNRFWSVDLESGYLSVMQSDLIKKKSMVTFLHLQPEFELDKVKTYYIGGWALHHLNSSKQLSCIVVSQVFGDLLRRVWGYFSYAEDRFLAGNYTISDINSNIPLPRAHRLFEYLDDYGLLLGNENGTIFATDLGRVVKKKKPSSSKRFFEFLNQEV